jgi:hypothetical protein
MFLPEATAWLQCDDPEVGLTSRLVSSDLLDLNHTSNINTLVPLRFRGLLWQWKGELQIRSTRIELARGSLD